MAQRSVSDSRIWNKCKENKRYIEILNGAERNAQKARPQTFGLAIRPDEIEIDLKMKDSKIIFQHLAALCGDLKKSHNRNDRPIGDHPRTESKNPRSRSNLLYRTSMCKGDKKYKTPISRNDKNYQIPDLKCDEAYKIPIDRSTIWNSSVSSNFNLQSCAEKQMRNRERSKKLKKEIKLLRKTCEKKGKKIVKEFEMNEKVRQKADQMKYKALKKDIQREIDERKRIAKQKLQRQREKINQKKKEEKSKLRMLKEKIKKKCKGLKYYVEDGCLDSFEYEA